MNDELTGVVGAQYFPGGPVWNAWQFWRNYNPEQIERELDFAEILNLNSLRVLLSYEHWYQEATNDDLSNHHLAMMEHFLTECDRRGIKPLFEIFEAPPEVQPTFQYRAAPFAEGTTLDDAGGVKSPAHRSIGLYPYNIRGYNWEGRYSPMHFTRRLANEFGNDPRVLAWEIMNEPGEYQPRVDFCADMTQAFREESPRATLTMGTKDWDFAYLYEDVTNGALDVHQVHHNLPPHPQRAWDYLTRGEEFTNETGKPVWCTEWQRTREEPPSRFMPHPQNMADTVYQIMEEGYIEGAFVWGLMIKPAYLRDPRRLGRYNGIFHEYGNVFNLEDARAVARDPGLDLHERNERPDWWSHHPFPYPRPAGEQRGVSGTLSRGQVGAIAALGLAAAAYERRG